MGLPQKHRPVESGYEESPQPDELPRSVHDRPDPDAAGNERAQVASAQHKVPGTGEPGKPAPNKPPDDDPLPPGEHKHEPIHDPDPSETKLHVRQASR